MQLLNTTPVAARIDIGAPGPDGLRRGMLVAKATYRYDAAGRVTLDDQDPYPIFLRDHPTPLGVLPKDDVPRLDDAFEVMLLGCAHAPGGVPTQRMTVALTVGDVRRELVVTGDRHWVGEGDAATISEPEPFVKMPLTWSRAFGGSAEIEVDEESFVDARDVRNPDGKGFDVAAEAAKLDAQLRCPSGYPRFDRARTLPNVEDPTTPIRAPSDNPEPAGWAPVDVTAAAARHMLASPNVAYDRIQFRCGAEWQLAQAPSAGTTITLEGLHANGDIALRLPSHSVTFDYDLGDRAGQRLLKPQALLLLPQERRLTLVSRLPFRIDPPSRAKRSAVIRMGGLS